MFHGEIINIATSLDQIVDCLRETNRLLSIIAERELAPVDHIHDVVVMGDLGYTGKPLPPKSRKGLHERG